MLEIRVDGDGGTTSGGRYNAFEKRRVHLPTYLSARSLLTTTTVVLLLLLLRV